MSSNSIISGINPPHGLLPPQVSEPARSVLEDCIHRIESVIQQTKLGVPNETLGPIRCLITHDTPRDPVQTNCGPLFDRTAIEAWLKIKDSCPMCKTNNPQIIPSFAIRELLEAQIPILTCPQSHDLDPECAAECLDLARKRVDRADYKGALGFVSQALSYTNSPAGDYAMVPSLYDQLGAPEKAMLSRLFLSLYQLQEGKIQEAIDTLKQYDSSDLDLTPVIVSLALQNGQSPETIKWAMIRALERNNPNDKVFIYKQIIAHVPDHLEAYQQLIPLIQDPAEKKALLLKAADAAHNTQQFELEAHFRTEAAPPPVSTAISATQWASAATLNLPPYPQALIDFLEEDCTICPEWHGKNKDHFIVVPLFPTVLIDDSHVPVPRTLKSLHLLDKCSGWTGYRYQLPGQIPEDIPAENEFRYAVMTNDVIPGSRNRSYDEQLTLLHEGYEMPEVLDAATAILWGMRRSETLGFRDSPWTYTCCKKIIGVLNNLIVGGYVSSGLDVASVSSIASVSYKSEHTGVAGWRKF